MTHFYVGDSCREGCTLVDSAAGPLFVGTDHFDLAGKGGVTWKVRALLLCDGLCKKSLRTF